MPDGEICDVEEAALLLRFLVSQICVLVPVLSCDDF